MAAALSADAPSKSTDPRAAAAITVRMFVLRVRFGANRSRRVSIHASSAQLVNAAHGDCFIYGGPMRRDDCLVGRIVPAQSATGRRRDSPMIEGIGRARGEQGRKAGGMSWLRLPPLDTRPSVAYERYQH